MIKELKLYLLLLTLLSNAITVLAQQEGANNDSIITPENINYIKYWGKDTVAVELEEEQPWSKFLKLELISKDIYEHKKSSAVKYLLADTSLYKMRNNTISLPCKNKTVVLTNKTNEVEAWEEYTYVGQLPILNAYLVKGLFYEELEYFLVDKITGEQTTYFGEFPFISPNKKFIIYLSSNPYDLNAEVGVYEIKNKKIQHLINLSFSNWMPDEQENIFWSNDGYLYLRANHPSVYWLEDGRVNTMWQYLRLKLVN